MHISVMDNSVARHNLYKYINNALQTCLALKMWHNEWMDLIAKIFKHQSRVQIEGNIL